MVFAHDANEWYVKPLNKKYQTYCIKTNYKYHAALIGTFYQVSAFDEINSILCYRVNSKLELS